LSIKKLINEFDEEIIRAFVQKNADYYITKWKLMAITDSKISWNWPAFLFGGFWLLYRKMYLYFFILFFISMLTAIPIIGMVISIALWVGLGMYGNFLYGKFTYEKLVQLKLITSDKEQLKLLASKKGGTSVLAVIIGIVILLLFLLFGVYALSIGTGMTNGSGLEGW